MSTNKIDSVLRDLYFSNSIFRVGEVVEDIKTGEPVKILDRGANYVTIATTEGFAKRWLNEIKEHTVVETVSPVVEVVETVVTPVITPEPKRIDPDFKLLESGQIKLFGYETRNFDLELSEFMLEQFSEFKDLYSKHQIIKCLDSAMSVDDVDLDHKYSLLEKVDKFYHTQGMESPILVEVIKNETERRRIAEIIAVIADVTPSKETSKTVNDSIKSLKEKYQNRTQWEVLVPLLKLAKDAGLVGATQNLPFSINSFDKNTHEQTLHDEIVIEAMLDNINLLVDDLEYEDITESFTESEFSDQLLSEALSIETRAKLSRKMRQHSDQLDSRKDRALSHAASTSVLMQRARRMAEVMVKRRIFHKAPENLSRQEKERFENGAGKRRALISRLAQKLVGKVRMLQSARLHHTNAPASATHDKAAVAISRQAAGHGAS